MKRCTLPLFEDVRCLSLSAYYVTKTLEKKQHLVWYSKVVLSRILRDWKNGYHSRVLTLTLTGCLSIHKNPRIEFLLRVYSPPWLDTTEGEIHVTTFDCTRRREKTRHWELLFGSNFTGRIRYPLGLSGPQTLDSCRLQTWSRLGSNQTLSLGEQLVLWWWHRYKYT
jgi:hypothetical protein